MNPVRELIVSSVLAGALILLSARMEGRVRYVMPGLIVFAVILGLDFMVATSDVVETALLELLRWMGEGPSVLRTGTSIGVEGTAALYPADPEALARLIHGLELPLSFGLSVLGFAPLIFAVLMMRFQDGHFLGYFALYLVIVTGLGALWIHGIGQELKFFRITWRFGSLGHWVTAIYAAAIFFGLPIALAKARESAQAASDGDSREWSIQGVAAQLFVIATFGTVGFAIFGLMYVFRAPATVQAVVLFFVSATLQGILAGVADDGDVRDAFGDWLHSISVGFREISRSGWRERLSTAIDRAVFFLLGSVALGGFFLVGALSLLAIITNEGERSIPLIIGAGTPFLLLIGVPMSTDFLGGFVGAVRSRGK